MASTRMDRPATAVLRICIARPEKRNAIDRAVRQELFEAITAASQDRTVRALVLGGVEGNLSAGGDIGTMEGLDEAGARARMQHIASLCLLVAASSLPIVTAAEGVAAGGAMGLALLGDHVVVAPTTKISFPFLRLGLAPDWGLLRTLPDRVGVAVARRLVTSGAVTTGAEARRIGLADELADDAMDAAVSRAVALAALPRDAFARTKARLAERASTLRDELRREEDDQAVLLRGADFAEGFAAFRERRDPSFS